METGGGYSYVAERKLHAYVIVFSQLKAYGQLGHIIWLICIVDCKRPLLEDCQHYGRTVRHTVTHSASYMMHYDAQSVIHLINEEKKSSKPTFFAF